jgi:membrane-anchored protein YejM (alkaline phosphatase superfamily)
MYATLLATHSWLRWLVLLLGLATLARALVGLARAASWSGRDERLARLFTVTLDVQVLVGVLLHLAISPITTAALRDPAAALANAVVRFWFLEHPVLMLAALAVAHVGLVRVRRATEPRRQARRAAAFFGLALALLLVGIPWPFSRVARPLWP